MRIKDTFLNREIQYKTSLSGYTYVSAYMKDRPRTRKTDKIVIASMENCGHQNRICEMCAREWSWDYDLLFERTEGGRRLKERIEERKASLKNNR